MSLNGVLKRVSESLKEEKQHAGQANIGDNGFACVS
jgi:hypothetical protein